MDIMDLRTKALQEGINTNAEETERWTTYKNDHEQTTNNLDKFEKSLEIEIMVPIGTKALMPGIMYHTNEVFVSHSNGIFSKCSSFQAKRICQHRIDVAEKRLKDLENERDLYQNKLDLPFDSNVFSSEDQHEIIEDYDEEKEKQWREEHKKHVRESKQRELKEREKIAKSNTEQTTADDKNVFEMLDELELMEELDNELETLNIDNMNDDDDDDDDDDDVDYVNKLKKNMQSESNSSTGNNNNRISSSFSDNNGEEQSNVTIAAIENSLEIPDVIETTNNLIEHTEINKSSKILNDNQLNIILPDDECKDKNDNNNNINNHIKNKKDDINRKISVEEEEEAEEVETEDNDYEYDGDGDYEDADDDDDDDDDDDENLKTNEYRRLATLCENYSVENKILFYTKHLERVEKELRIKSHSLELFNLHDDLKVILEHLNDIILTDKYLEQLENVDGVDGDIINNNSDLTPSTPSTTSDLIGGDDDDDDDHDDEYVKNPEVIQQKRKISFGEEHSVKKFYSHEEPFKLYETTGINLIKNHNDENSEEEDDPVPLISPNLTLQINFQHSDKKFDSTKYDNEQETKDNILIKTPSHIYTHYAHCMKMTAKERKQKNDLKEFVLRIATANMNNNNNNSLKEETTKEKSPIECDVGASTHSIKKPSSAPTERIKDIQKTKTKEINKSENDHESNLNNSQTKSILKNKEAVNLEIHNDNKKKEESDDDDDDDVDDVKLSKKFSKNSMKANKNRNKPTFYYDPKDEATILDNDEQTNDTNFIKEPARKISLFKASRMKNK